MYIKIYLKNFTRPLKITTNRVAENLLGDSFQPIKGAFFSGESRIFSDGEGPPNSGGGGPIICRKMKKSWPKRSLLLVLAP